MLYGLYTSSAVTKNKCYFSLTMKTDLQTCRVAQNILNKQSRTADKGWPTSWEVRHEIDVPVCGEQRNHRFIDTQYCTVTEILIKPSKRVNCELLTMLPYKITAHCEKQAGETARMCGTVGSKTGRDVETYGIFQTSDKPQRICSTSYDHEYNVFWHR
jgi:hypothetical protein